MDLDEYDYLDESVEDAPRSKRTKEEEAHRDGSRRRREHDKELGGEDEKEKKRSRAEWDDRERSSRREKERHRSGEKERERDEGRRSGEREHRERDRDEERERERRREREREKERGGERESERERRSSSRSRMHDREIERVFERSRSRDSARRERELEREIIESRRSREKKEVVEPEADPERDRRTVFAYQMPLKATEKDVYEFFSKAGKVRDVRLIMDRNSRRSKGVGYIEFYDAMSVPMAIALSGQLLLGQPVMVKPSEAEKNLVQTNTSGSTGAVGGVAARKIYVGNLPVNMTEDQLRQVFEPFGQVELVQLPLDLESGHCRGYGFVQFAQVEFAKAAQTLNGKLEIGGRTIKVSSVTDHVSGGDAATNAAADLDDDEGGGLVDILGVMWSLTVISA
ncbi:RNA-binding protein 39-like isoform X2 [Ananas comosus]|uniref:RNA-binding protein 39-like isoform X2 n=1 Tax=Ananas comosus TaxID=4615 RepID=A0A6P5H131_ANACO|nr:RNA-binding protein 39-like isoform X2 [Ananas comosus]